MPKKGKEKNTKNKAKHARLMAQKKHREASEKQLRKERLKKIVANAKSNMNDD